MYDTTFSTAVCIYLNVRYKYSFDCRNDNLYSSSSAVGWLLYVEESGRDHSDTKI